MKPGERLVPVRPIETCHGRARAEESSRGPADAPLVHLDVRGISKSFETRGGGLFGQRKGVTFAPSTT
jgi:hypothetical protein